MCDVPESDIQGKCYDHLNFSRASGDQFRASRYIMRLNWTSVCKVMTIWISGELSLFNFKRLHMWCSQIRHPSEKLWPFWISQELPVINFKRFDMLSTWIGHLIEMLWPFEFHESFRCSILCVWIYYAPDSDLCVKSYDQLNFSRASGDQFRASGYVIRLNRTSMWKVLTIWISRELSLFNFERLDILCARIGHSCKTLWPFEFVESFRCSISSLSIYHAPESDLRVKSSDNLNFSRSSDFQFRASRYMMRLNWTSERKVTNIWIPRELPLFNVERLDILWSWIGHSFEKLLTFEFLESFRCSMSSVWIYYAPESDFRVKSYDHCSILSVSIYYSPESDIRVISYDHLNFSTSSGAQFRASRYIMRLNRISDWKVMTIWISRKLLLFNFERLNMLSTWIGHPIEKLWPFEFLESFRCSIFSVLIYYSPESDICMISYDHLNFSRASGINYERLDMLSTWIGHLVEKLWPFEFLAIFRCLISSMSICDVPELDIREKS